jgi:nitroreductase
MGLGTCWVWGDSAPYADAVRDMLHVPEDYRLIALVAAGYPAESPKPRKKTLAEDSFWDTDLYATLPFLLFLIAPSTGICIG